MLEMQDIHTFAAGTSSFRGMSSTGQKHEIVYRSKARILRF